MKERTYAQNGVVFSVAIRRLPDNTARASITFKQIDGKSLKSRGAPTFATDLKVFND